MERSRLDQVHVDVAGDVVEIAWDERDALLFKLRFVAGSETIIQTFEAVGARRPADLTDNERTLLRAALQVWEDAGDPLPDGLARLLDALVQAAPRSEA